MPEWSDTDAVRVGARWSAAVEAKTLGGAPDLRQG